MKNDEIETKRGQVHALNMVLTHVIAQMPQVAAARAAAGLAVEHFGSVGYDQNEPGNPHEIEGRTALVEVYLELLKAAALRA